MQVNAFPTVLLAKYFIVDEAQKRLSLLLFLRESEVLRTTGMVGIATGLKGYAEYDAQCIATSSIVVAQMSKYSLFILADRYKSEFPFFQKYGSRPSLHS